jgi:uncharacterized Zn finger protein
MGKQRTGSSPPASVHALAGSALAEPLRRRAWLTQFDATTIERGRRYAQQGRVSLVGIDGDTLLTPGHGVRRERGQVHFSYSRMRQGRTPGRGTP